MRSIWMLTAANLRKSKSQTASLLLFALIAAMLLNIGLVMSLKIGVFSTSRPRIIMRRIYRGFMKREWLRLKRAGRI